MRAKIVALSFVVFWGGAGWGICEILFSTTPVSQASLAGVETAMVPAAQAAVHSSQTVTLSRVAYRQEQARHSRRLYQVAAQTSSKGGPGEACFDQLRSAFCPIVGKIPVLRDFAGQMAILGNFSCPMESPRQLARKQI